MQNVITFLTHNVITQNVITGVVLRNHYQNPVTFTYTLIDRIAGPGCSLPTIYLRLKVNRGFHLARSIVFKSSF